MRTRILISLTFLAVLGVASSNAFADIIVLNDWCININGTATCSNGTVPPDNLPLNVNGAGFDFTFSPDPNTLGMIAITLSPAASPQFVMVYFDYDVSFDELGSFDDYGLPSGAPPAGMSWKIGDKNLVSIYDDVALNAAGTPLDNTNASVQNDLSDVELALMLGGLDAGGGTVTFSVNSKIPQGFYLAQTNNDTGTSIYLSGSFSPTTIPTPEPGSLILLAIGTAGVLAAWKVHKT